jgi:hypothetical protein
VLDLKGINGFKVTVLSSYIFMWQIILLFIKAVCLSLYKLNVKIKGILLYYSIQVWFSVLCFSRKI